MRLDALTLWYLGNPAEPRPVGTLRLVSGGKGVSLQYGKEWLASGFAIVTSELKRPPSTHGNHYQKEP